MPTIAHFDIAAENLEKARKFYEDMFDWKMAFPPGMENAYYLFETKDLKGKKGTPGGFGKRMDPGEKITNYFGVKSIDEAMAKVPKAGGKLISPKMPVPGFGYLVNCLDTEGNMFGLWQDDPKAKMPEGWKPGQPMS